MRIAINTLAVSDGNEGIRTMLVGLVEALVRADPADEYLLICSRANEHLFSPAASSSGGRASLKVLGQRRRLPLARIVHDQLTVPWLVRRDVDLLLTPASVGSLLSGVPQVVMVPHHLSLPSIRGDAGLAPFSLPYRLYFGPVMRLSHRRAAAVTPISADLGRSLVADTGISPTKVEPILCGIDLDTLPPPGDPAPAGDYALFVSTLYPYKNAATMIRAFALSRPRLPEGFRAVIVGRDPDGHQIPALAQLAHRQGVDDVVDLAGKVSDADLARLYAGAAVFVFPSFAEGFGFPALEAMAKGVPVIASDRSALPEVVGDAGLLIDPTNPAELADAMVHVIGDDVLRNQLVKAGRARAEDLSWDRSAGQFVELFHRLVS